MEEKIVERAQQKLKLDAMVVQQGRLKEKDKVTKEEIMAAVRFGADSVFRSEESTITDEDIDVILARGEAKTKEMEKKIQQKDKGDMLDFRLDGGISAQTFEGVDYSDSHLREHLRMMAANSMGKRERRPPTQNYNPIIHTKKSMTVNDVKIKLPRCLRVPNMEDHQFYNRERLLELGKLEFEAYAALREAGELPPKEVMERKRSLLPVELATEKIELLDEGFGDWTKTQYFNFIKATAKHGRDEYAAIAAEMDLAEESIIAYSKAFWEYGPTELQKEWERVVGTIERGEKKLAKQKKLSNLLTQFIRKFDNAREEMTFANKGTTHFAQEQDRALLCAVEKHGYGNWDLVREEIRNDARLKFQHSVQGMSVQAIAKRCDYRMRQMERELDAREKAIKNKRAPTVAAAFKAIEAIKEVEDWEARARELVLDGRQAPPYNMMSSDGKQLLQERTKEQEQGVFRLREIEVQTQRALKIAEDTKKSIYDGAQYVNYSSIALRAPGGSADNGGENVKEGVKLEAEINSAVLKIPPCSQCSNCNNSNTKLCLNRLEVRKRMIRANQSRMFGKKKVKQEPKKPGPKKKKPDSKPKPPAPKSSADVEDENIRKRKKQLMLKTSDGKLKVRVTSQGNKRMSIPDALFPEFCRRISATGTAKRQQLINKFIEENPTISNRQVTMRLAEIITKERPACVPKPEGKCSRFTIYLRPAFYKYLPEDERPPNWEPYAEEDEKMYNEEQAKMVSDEPDSIPSADSPTSAERVSSSDLAMTGEGDETEDEDAASPASKKPRVE